VTECPLNARLETGVGLSFFLPYGHSRLGLSCDPCGLQPATNTLVLVCKPSYPCMCFSCAPVRGTRHHLQFVVLIDVTGLGWLGSTSMLLAIAVCVYAPRELRCLAALAARVPPSSSGVRSGTDTPGCRAWRAS
jgi:hypothetical protein